MSNQEFVEKYLSYYHLKISEGRKDSFEPLLPFLIMDAMFQVFCEDIRPVEVHYETKRIRKEWIRNYNEFNKHYYRPFTIDELDALIDNNIEPFEKFISNDLALVKSAAMTYMVECGFGDEPFGHRKIIVSSMVCNILTQSATVIWDRLFGKLNIFVLERNRLRQIRRLTDQFTNSYWPIKVDLDCNKSESVCAAVDRLCKQIVFYLKCEPTSE